MNLSLICLEKDCPHERKIGNVNELIQHTSVCHQVEQYEAFVNQLQTYINDSSISSILCNPYIAKMEQLIEMKITNLQDKLNQYQTIQNQLIKSEVEKMCPEQQVIHSCTQMLQFDNIEAMSLSAIITQYKKQFKLDVEKQDQLEQIYQSLKKLIKIKPDKDIKAEILKIFSTCLVQPQQQLKKVLFPWEKHSNNLNLPQQQQPPTNLFKPQQQQRPQVNLFAPIQQQPQAFCLFNNPPVVQQQTWIEQQNELQIQRYKLQLSQDELRMEQQALIEAKNQFDIQQQELSQQQEFDCSMVCAKQFDFKLSSQHVEFTNNYTTATLNEPGYLLVRGLLTFRESDLVGIEFQSMDEISTKIGVVDINQWNRNDFSSQEGMYYLNMQGELVKEDTIINVSLNLQNDSQVTMTWDSDKKRLIFEQDDESAMIRFRKNQKGKFAFFIYLEEGTVDLF